LKLPLGYRFAATYAGLRKVNTEDLGLIISDTPASAAAVTTKNLVQAAPVKIARQHLRASRGRVSAVLVNAGNANCATRTGDQVALACCKAVANKLKVPVAQVIPASTGVMGVEMDEKLVVEAIPRLFEDLLDSRFPDVVHAMMTTDTVPKMAFAEVPLKGGEVQIAGMTKGSGMIHPQMATTLGFVMTDANIPVAALRAILKRTVERSYNRLSVDGDTSTNDTLLLLANGASGVRPDPKEMPAVEEAIAQVMEGLARAIARDGEGAKKLITIHISGAPSDDAAGRMARAIANSPLVKTAIAGSDPNWGRILSAAGNSGVPFDPGKTDIHMQGVAVCKSGLAAPFSEPELKRKLDAPDCEIRVSLRGKGKGAARFWTCDLTEDYIRINASYRT
jgi:glutamate N-acetyltransferase / amino-acid N-acetyltransferase